MRRVVFAVLLMLWAAGTAAQEIGAPGPGERGPRFYAAAPGAGALVPVEASKVAVLRRRVTFDLTGATLREALETISRRANLRINYSASLVPLDLPVTIQARNLTVAAILTEVLLDAGVDVVVMPSGQLTLRKQPRQAVGAIVGRVTDTKTGDGLVNAEVLLEGTRWRTATGDQGRYRLTEVVPGNYTLTVRRVGYGRESRAIVVAEGAEVTVDVALQPVATQLDEIVTTVTGEQRLRELGHVIGRISADSLVKEAPISSVTELLASRVPGLIVQQVSGTVGGEVSLRVRSVTTATLNLEPIIIVDGVRYQGNPQIGPNADRQAGEVGFGPFNAEGTSRLNDLNPNDIETIEVVKGPSAATLYGTDAANGVIVITTKRGRAGPARWNTYVRATQSEIPRYHYPEVYWAWGRRVSNGLPLTFSCTLPIVAARFCVQDSVTALPNPLNDPAKTIFATGPQWEYGMNASGGHPDLRYYIGGDIEQKTGPIRLPAEVAEALRRERGVTELPEELLKPNMSSKSSVRATLAAAAGSRADVHLNVGYVRNATRTLVFGNPFLGAFFGRPGAEYNPAWNPANAFSQSSTERVGRFTGGVGTELRPAPWLNMRASIGLDYASSVRESLARAGEAPNASAVREGVVGDNRMRYITTTGDVGAAMTWRHHRISSRTSVGAQYVRSLNDAVSVTGSGLPVGSERLGDAASISTSKDYYERVTLGSYVEQTFGLNDRLYLNGALRFDGATGFGRDYDVAVYPKVGLSWILSEEPFVPHLPGVDELRLRYAFGASGQQPWPRQSQPQFLHRTALADGVLGSSVIRTELGNPDLRPERVREHEFGLDASAWQGRVGLSLTWNERRTTDALWYSSLPAGLGSRYVNIGLISGHGFEMELTGQLVRSPALTVDMALSHSWQDGKLESVGGAVLENLFAMGLVEGYPIGAWFGRPVQFEDANGDGIVDRAEVDFNTRVYVGRSTPPRTQTLRATVGGFKQRVRLTALLDRQSGFVQRNRKWMDQCDNSRCRELVDPTTPLAVQAGARSASFSTLFFQPGDFTRLREVSLGLDLPGSVARAFRLRSASVTLSCRNLALWTSYSSDPESHNGDQSIPQARMWVLRADLGL